MSWCALCPTVANTQCGVWSAPSPRNTALRPHLPHSCPHRTLVATWALSKRQQVGGRSPREGEDLCEREVTGEGGDRPLVPSGPALGSLCGSGLCPQKTLCCTVSCGLSVALRPPTLPPSHSDSEAPEGRAFLQQHLSLALTLCIWGVTGGLSNWCGAVGSRGSPETWQGRRSSRIASNCGLPVSRGTVSGSPSL